MKSDGSTSTGEGIENPLDGQKQSIGTNPQNVPEKVSEDSLDGNTSTPTISESASSKCKSGQCWKMMSILIKYVLIIGFEIWKNRLYFKL